MIRPVVPGSAIGKSPDATAEGLVGADVAQLVVAERHLREVHDEVGALREAQEQPVAVRRGQIDRRGRNPPSLPICQTSTPGIPVEVEDQEARIAAVEEPEPVAALLDVQERPGVAR